MNVIDIIFGIFFCYALYKGIKNGLFIELASLVALAAGIYVAIKFSYITSAMLAKKIDWSVQYIEIIAFSITFLGVVILIHLLARILTKIVDFAYLGWLNKLAGSVFGVLRITLFLSVIILFFEKMNNVTVLVDKETLNASVFYNPIKETASFIYPQIEEKYKELTSKNKD